MATLARHDTHDLPARLAALVGGQHVLTADDDRRFYGTDVWHAGPPPVAVVRPGSAHEVEAIVRLCHDTRTPLMVRGGGASYTDGYVQAAGGGITLSTERLTRILAIDEENALVTVEPGVTWAELHKALSPRGWRTPFFGPFSGLVATVGGSISQNSISHGTGTAGVSAESVVSLELVTGTGERLATGSAGSARAHPFFRHFGPDLAGLFTGDCGALGVKVAITLRMLRARPHAGYASFSLPSFEALHEAMRAIAAEGLDDENFALDATLQQGQIGRSEGVGARAGLAREVMRGSGSVLGGLKSLGRMALAGDRELRQASYVAHYVVEGSSEGEVEGRLARLRALARGHGEEIADTVPRVVKAMPFQPLTNTLGPRGERWVPVHALLPHSGVAGFHRALRALFEARRETMERHQIVSGAMFMSVGPSAFVYEPTFYWPDAASIYHERVVPAEHWKTIERFPADEGARAAVVALKDEVGRLMHEHGAAHFQIGRFYRFAEGRNAAAMALLRAVKEALDPRSILQPGVLGLFPGGAKPV